MLLLNSILVFIFLFNQIEINSFFRDFK